MCFNYEAMGEQYGIVTVLARPTVLSHAVPETLLARLRENGVMRLVRMLPPLPFSVIVHARFQRRFSLFRNPTRFSELITHKKIYDHNPLFTKTADKFAVREYVAEAIGEQYLIPMQQVVDQPEHIDWQALRGQVVIKGTHGCNMTMLVDTRRSVDVASVNAKTREWLAIDWYDMWKEWAYRNIPPRLIIEEFIGVDGSPPADFKFHTFNGRVEMIQIDTDRFSDHKSTMFSPDWRRLNVGSSFGVDESTLKPPANIDQMIGLAETLAKPFDYARIDLYNVNGRIYFGEITHYPGAASVSFDPPSFDDALGALWRNGTPIPAEFYA